MRPTLSLPKKQQQQLALGYLELNVPLKAWRMGGAETIPIASNISSALGFTEPSPTSTPTPTPINDFLFGQEP